KASPPDASPASPASSAAPAPLSKLAELDAVAKQAHGITIIAEIERSSGDPIQVVVRAGKHWASALAHGTAWKRSFHHAHSMPPALEVIARDLRGQGRLAAGSVKVRSSESPLRGEKLRDLGIAALCEAFGEAVPTADDLAKRREKARGESREQAKKTRSDRKEPVALLSTGTEGVAEGNKRRKEGTKTL